MSGSNYTAEQLDKILNGLPKDGGLKTVDDPDNQGYLNEIYWYLKAGGYVYTRESTHDVLVAGLTAKGIVTLNEGGFNGLHKKDDRENKIKELQLNELEFQKRIRKQNSIIRIWQIVSIGATILAFLLGFFLKLHRL